MGMQQAATGKPSLEDQIRAQWGKYGDWKSADQDQVAALATMLRQNGVEDLSKFQLKAREYDIPGYTNPHTGDTGQGRKGTAYDATYDGKQLGFLGDINRDGSYSAKPKTQTAGLEQLGLLGGNGDELGWSAQGGGNTSFKVVQGPDGQPVVVPTWQSSSAQTYGDLKGAAMVAAMAAGGYYAGAGAGADAATLATSDIGIGGAAAGGGGATGGMAAAAGGTAASASEQIAMLAANGMSDAAIAEAFPALAEAGGLTGVGGGAAATVAAEGATNFRPSQNYGEGLTGNQTTVYDKVVNATGSPGMANIAASNVTVADGLVKAGDVIGNLSDVNSVPNVKDAGNNGNGGSKGMNWLDVVNTAATVYGISKAGDASSDATDAAKGIADAQLGLNKEALDWYKQVYADQAPARDAAATRANAISDAQLKGMNFAIDQANELDSYNKSTFRPIEQQLVAGAADYNTAERRETAANAATGQVASSYDIQREQAQREMERAGVDPSTVYALGVSSRLDEAKAQAGAANNARTGVEQQGWSRMADVANMGRGIASQQATQQGIATTTGNSSTANTMQGLNATQSGNNLMAQGYQNATQGNQVVGNLFNQAAAGQRADDQLLLNGIGGVTNYLGNKYPSSEKVKTGTGRMMNNAKALQQVEDLPVKREWKYDPKKGGPDDGGVKHDGAMAEDVQRVMGNDVAPGGKAIDIQSMNGRMAGAIQQLSKDVKGLKKVVSRMKEAA